jgi:hypothetical protein
MVLKHFNYTDFPYNPVYELQIIDTDGVSEFVLEFASDDEESALSLIKILTFLRKLISKNRLI